jgi:hypothetical protein
VIGRATGRTPVSRHGRQRGATRHGCAVAQTGGVRVRVVLARLRRAALRDCGPFAAGGRGLRALAMDSDSRVSRRRAARSPGAAVCCLSWAEWLLLFPPAATRASPGFIAFATTFGIGAHSRSKWEYCWSSGWPCGQNSQPKPECHQRHCVLRGGRRGLLVLTAGPLRYSSIGVIPPARWLRPYLVERAGVVCLLLPRYPNGAGKS